MVSQQLRTRGRSCRHCCIKLLTCCRTSQARLASWKHSIDTGTAPPAHQALYHLPHAYWETVRAELQQMLEAGIIVRSSSEWASTIVLVGKKDGSLRLCVDYKQHNAVAWTNAYPMPRVDDLTDQVGKGKYLTTLDLARGYWQVPVAPNSQHLTAFKTLFGLYQFQVMPFGLSGAPNNFPMHDGPAAGRCRGVYCCLPG